MQKDHDGDELHRTWRHRLAALCIVWTLGLLGALWWSIGEIKEGTGEIALTLARAYFNKDQALRFWASSHGGVYVPVSEKTPPNEHLAHVPERDITTPSGKKLTLMNPAYVLRQIQTDFPPYYGVRGHITSLKPTNTLTAPDDWERDVLQQLEKGAKEIFEFKDIGGKAYLRLMAPLVTDRACLKCHAVQGYQTDDIRGGVSVSVPMEQLLLTEHGFMLRQALTHCCIWLIGFAGIALAVQRLEKRETEKKRALEMLRDGELRYRTVADFAYHWEYWVSPEGKMLYVSPSSERLTGYSPEEFTQDPDLLQRIVHLDDKAGFEAHENDVKNSIDPSPSSFDCRIIRKDGELRWISHCSRPVHGEGGEYLGRRASNSDISDRIRSEKALNLAGQELEQRVEQRTQQLATAYESLVHEIEKRDTAERALRGHALFLETLLEAMPVPVFYKDVSGRLLGCNEAFSRILKQPMEEMIGKTLHELVPSELADIFTATDDDLQSGAGTRIYEAQMEHPDGTIVDAVFFKSAFRDSSGDVGGILGVILDDTENRRVHKALAASEARARAIVEHAPIGIGIVRNGITVFANDALNAITGGNIAGDLVGRAWEEVVVPDDRPRMRDWFRDTIDGKDAPASLELRGLKGNDEQTALHFWADLIDHEGASAVLVFVVDRTEANRLRSQALHAQKMEAMGTMAGGIAHEFNNLLTIISGYAELLMSERAQGDPDHQDLKKIVDACRRGAELVAKLQVFGRSSDHDLRPLDLNHEILSIENILSRTLPPTIAVMLDLAPDLRMVRADSARMNQVIMNLAMNAAEAMPDGGILTVRTRNIEGSQSDRADDRRAPSVEVSVADTGHGMDEETVTRAFEPFFTTKGLANSSGLGLAVVHGIVEEHGGHVSCAGGLGLGAVFTIRLPTVEVGEKKPVSTAERVTGVTHDTILLVDDEELIRELGSRILTRAGYRVICAGDGIEALELFEKENGKISLVILDLTMPRMDGTQCLTELRKRDPLIRVLVASGHSDAARGEGLFRCGADGFVGKPFAVRDLLQKVRENLSSST
ncbi:MAG: PAS domain S-box protein [Pseudomonadota bacterium]